MHLWLIFSSPEPKAYGWAYIRITHVFSCINICIPDRVAQSVTCLVTDAKLTADPGVASSIPARSHTFVEIDHEIISTVILLPSAESFMKGCCQLQAKVCARLLVNCLFKLAQEKSVVRWTDRLAMTIAVDLGRKATKTNKKQLTFAGSRGSCLNARPLGRVFKHRPRDPASVNAMKQTCVIVILAYFTWFQHKTAENVA